jgi:hypothetical protein
MATQVTLNSGSVDSAGSLALKTNGTTTAVTIDTSQNVGIGVTPSTKLDTSNSNGRNARIGGIQISGTSATADAGNNFVSSGAYWNGTNYTATATTSAITQYANGILNFYTDSGLTAGNTFTASSRMTLDSSGNVGIGTNSPAATQSGLDISSGGLSLVIGADSGGSTRTNTTTKVGRISSYHYTNAEEPVAVVVTSIESGANTIQFGGGSSLLNAATDLRFLTAANTTTTTGTERARITSGGDFLVGKTGGNISAVGCQIEPDGLGVFTADGAIGLLINRLTSDGDLVSLRQAGTQEGTISVSGTTVSYNGGHLSRWAQTTTAKDESLVKGTVLSNLDEMNVYTDAEGNPVDNEQLNKVKVSDVEGDANVAGVFVNWTHDDAHDVDEINMAMTGDMIIRIAQGVIVARGDLLMSAGDGTAKPQGDDIVRSKTIAKVTSTHVTCTYADGSFCVPCVLMAC